MQNHRKDKTSYHIKFEGLGFRDYHAELKFKRLIESVDDIARQFIDVAPLGRSKQSMRLPNQGKENGGSGFKVIKLAINASNNVGDLLWGIYDNRAFTLIHLPDIQNLRKIQKKTKNYKNK